MSITKKSIINNIKKVQKLLLISDSPQMNIVLGFFIYGIVGFGLLSIPWFHKVEVGLLDNIFTATSAISTTGLVTQNIFDTYNFFGQFVILILFQFGGIGYMTLTTYYLLFSAQKISHWHKKIIGAEFDMPKNIRIKDFIKSIIVFSVVMEILGSICLFIAFKLNGMETLKAIWYGIFHSISAFCTAGLDLFDNSFQGFNDNIFINTALSILCISGSLGFIVVTDLWYRIRKKTKKLSFTTKIVTIGLVFLLLLGTTLVYLFEPSLNSSDQKLLDSFFLAMTSVTTVGFSTVSTGKLSLSILMVITFLMYIGASPSGTAGGMKITTFTAIISLIKSRMFGQKKVTFFAKEIPNKKVLIATSTFILYTSTIFIFTFLLTFTEDFDYKNIIFEVGSALGTVGLTTGITAQLSSFGKILIIILMFIGRLGVLTFGFALLKRDSKKNKEEDDQSEQEDLAMD